MWFYKQVPTRSVLAGSETELQLRVGVVVAWLASVLILVGLAIASPAIEVVEGVDLKPTIADDSSRSRIPAPAIPTAPTT